MTENNEQVLRIRAELTANAVMARSQLLQRLMDPRRDIDAECGYPDTDSITDDHYQDFYDRHPIANRIVEAMPSECWKVQPTVFEDQDMDVTTEFEQAWDDLGRNLMVEVDEENLYQGEEGNPIWDYLKRIDVLSGIGHFGVMLLGLNDGVEMQEPVRGKKLELLYIRCFPAKLVEIVQWESDPANPRYGRPNMYSITLNDPTDNYQGIGLPQATVYVHWSRVIHVAETMTSSELFAAPRMRAVWNNLLDLKKLYGGSAEMYWRGAFPGLSLETHPQLGGDVEIDVDDAREQLENYMHTLQRYLAIPGVTAKTLAPQVVDPTPQIRNHLEAIAIKLAMPMRILLGSERGELASTQDKGTWNERLMSRQKNYLTPRLICPFVSRLVRFGVLPRPAEFFVEWPDMNEMDATQKSTIAVQKTDAMAKYVGGSVDQLMDPMNFLTRIIGLQDSEAEEVVEAATQYVEDKMEEEAEMMAEHPELNPANQVPPEQQQEEGGFDADSEEG